MKKLFTICTTLIAIALSMVIFCGCVAQTSSTVFGTYYNVKLAGAGSNAVLKQIEISLNEYESLFSAELEGSDIYKINNAAAHNAVKVDTRTIKLIARAKELYELTDKAFNPALYPLIKLWKFDPKNFLLTVESIPTAQQISDTITYCNMDLFTVDTTASTVSKSDSRAMLDLGGIAKGYATYAARNTAAEHNISDCLIDIGGEITVGDTVKKIGIVSPFNPDSAFADSSVSSASVATSGVYERYYIFDSVKYHHVLDKSGYPSGLESDNPTVSVSIVASDGMTADALATYGLIADFETAKALYDDLAVSALFIYADKTYKTVGSVTWNIRNV